MKLSCALVLTLANLVIATPFSFSVKGSGASAKAEAATPPFGQFGVVKPTVSQPSGFSGSFSKSSSSSFASSSASSSSSAFNYNAGQVGTASLGYGSQGELVPNKNEASQIVTVPQATAFATAGSNGQSGAPVSGQATGSYSSEKGNADIPANAQYQSAVPESKPNSYVGLSSEAPGHWHEQSKPNTFNTNANVNKHSEKPKESIGVQSFSNNVQSPTSFLSTPVAPSQTSPSVENVPSYTGGFGGPPGLLSPQDKISFVGSTPGYNGFPSYPSGAQLNVPYKQQTFVNTPVSTVNPAYAQQDYPAGNIKPTIQSINQEYVSATENSKPPYKPDIKPSYIEQNKPTGPNSYVATLNQWQHNDGQHITVQPHSEVSHTHKEFEQIAHSIDQYPTNQYATNNDKPNANNNNAKPVKNIQIFIQPVPSKAPQANPVYVTNSQISSENKKEVKPTAQILYTGGFGAPAGILKPSGQYVSSGQTFSSFPVKNEQYDSSSVGLTATGAKETTFNTAFGGSSNIVTPQPTLQSTNDYSFVSGSTSGAYVTPKPSNPSLFASSPSEQISNDFVTTEPKGTDQFSSKPSESSFLNPTVSSWAQKPTVNSLPSKPEYEVQKKPTVENVFNAPSPTPYSPEQGLGGSSVGVDKTKPTTLFVSLGPVSEDIKPTIQPAVSNNGFVYSNIPYKPVINPTTPHFEATKEKESSFVSSTTTQPTPVNSWQQSTTTYKPSFEGSPSQYFDSQKTSPTKYPSLTGEYTVSKQTEQYPSNVGSTPVDFYVASNLNKQSSNYGSTGASFVAQEPAAQVNYASPTTTSFSQESSHKPTIENSLTTSSASQFSPQQNPSTGTFTVSKEVYKVPTQTVSNNVYPPGSVGSVFHLIPNSEISQAQFSSHQNQQATNYGDSTSFVTQKPTTGGFVSQTPDAPSGPTSASFTQQSIKPTVSSFLPSSTVSGSYVSSNVSPSQKPFSSLSFGAPKETKFTSDTTSNVDSAVGSAPAFNTNEKPQTQFGVPQQSVEYKPTASADVSSQTITSAISRPTTFSQQSSNKQTVENVEGTSAVSVPETPKTTPSKNPQYQFPTKPTTETAPQKQPVQSNVFGTSTGTVKPSSYSPSSSNGYPWSSSNRWSAQSYVTGSYDKPKQTTYFVQNKPTVSSFPERKETIVPTNKPYFTSNFASNNPITAKPSIPVAPLNIAQQSSQSIAQQKEKEATATSESGATFSKPTSQTIVNNSGVTSTAIPTPKPTKPTNQLPAVNPAFSSFGSSFSQVKPQYQFSTVQPATQKKQWYSNNYGTFGAVKPHSYTYPGFTSSFTSFGQGSVGGLYDKTKQTQYTSTGQYKPSSTGRYTPSQTGQYKPISTGQYKPTYNWGVTSQSQFQKPSNQPTQTGGSYVSTYTQTTNKPFVTQTPVDTQKPTSGVSFVNQKGPSIPSTVASSTGVAKPTNQPSTSYVALKPTSIETSATGSPQSPNVSNEGKVTSSIVSTTSKYDIQKPVNPTIQTVPNTYPTSFISAKPTANFQTTGSPLLQNKPTSTYNVQQVVPSVQSTAPTKDVEYSELSQSIKPTGSPSYEKESSDTSNLKPSSSAADGSNNYQFVDKTQTGPVKPTSGFNFAAETISSLPTDSTLNEFSQSASGSVSTQKPSNQINGQIGSTTQASLVAQKNPTLQQPSQPFSTSLNYHGNTHFHSHPQAQPAFAKPEYPSTFGETWVQSTSSKQTTGGLESSSAQKGSVHVDHEQVHSKPSNTPVISTSQTPTVVGFNSATSQFSKAPSTVYIGSRPDKIQYTSQNVQSSYKPTPVVGSISSYTNQQNINPANIPASQETYSNIASSGPNKPGQYWALNTQSSAQQTAFLTQKPNIKITVVAKPSNTVVRPSYSGGFGGPSGILKPNEFGVPSTHANIQSQFQGASGAYNSAIVDSNTASHSASLGGSSGVSKPYEAQSIHATTSHIGGQANYNLAPNSGTQEYVKEQTGHGSQAYSEVQGSLVTNVAGVAPNAVTNPETSVASNAQANTSGFASSNTFASSAEAGKTGSIFGGQTVGISGPTPNASGEKLPSIDFQKLRDRGYSIASILG